MVFGWSGGGTGYEGSGSRTEGWLVLVKSLLLDERRDGMNGESGGV